MALPWFPFRGPDQQRSFWRCLAQAYRTNPRFTLASAWRLHPFAERAWRSFSLAVYGRGFLLDFYAAAAEAGMRPFLMWGTLLGYVREGRLMPHDKDLDVGIVAADYKRKDALVAAMIARGHVLKRDEPYKLAFLHEARTLSLDMDVFYPWNGRMICSTFRRGRLTGEAFDLDAFETLQEVSFLDGLQVLIPHRATKILETIYGDWQVPESGYRSGRGPRNRVYWDATDAHPVFPSGAEA